MNAINTHNLVHLSDQRGGRKKLKCLPEAASLKGAVALNYFSLLYQDSTEFAQKILIKQVLFLASVLVLN